ncbi:MAG TPA: hypothetical protein VKI18_12125, partial [Albitalea sp.]|nr:hypothetical protein [Albitalea sp.]
MHRRLRRGASLLEALIAFAVLSLGLLGMVRLQSHLRLEADIARQRSEAVRLAQQDIETLRGFAALAAAANQRSYAGITSAVQATDVTNTHYDVTRGIADNTGHKTVSVTAAWSDRTGKPQSVALESLIAGSDPLHAAALGVVQRAHAVKAVLGRSPNVPLAAKDLGDGRSVLKPVSTGTLAFVFSNLTGQIIGRCNAVSPTTSTGSLTAADIAGCDSVKALLLSGVVRFSTSSPPDAARANDTPLALSMDVALTGGSYPAAPQCGAEPQTLSSGERFVAYHCMITPLAGRWSGRSSVVPQGWVLGSAASQYKVCRYSA